MKEKISEALGFDDDESFISKIENEGLDYFLLHYCDETDLEDDHPELAEKVRLCKELLVEIEEIFYESVEISAD